MGGYQILLVDGDPENLHAECKVLENMDYHVITATNGETAMKELKKGNFDLVITDHSAVLEKAKEMNSETMAIIMLTSNGRLTSTARAFRFDADDYLYKPFELTELGMRVANCIGKLELERRNSQSESQERPFNEKVLSMLNIVSHDIRGSLVSMSATLKLLSRGYYGKMDEGVANHLDDLLLKTISLIGIAEEYLGRTFSVNDDLEVEGETLDLRQDIINPVLEELAAEINDRHVLIDNCKSAISAGPIPIKGSKLWLKIVFRNLIKNAIKYGDKGGTIVISVEDRKSFYQLNVYNRGKPIPEEHRDKLFTKFTRFVNNSNGNEMVDGMGLGLYLIKTILQKHGGKIWYEAKENGSNFVFTLPITG